MSTTRALLLTAAFGVSIGSVVYQGRLILVQREELQQLQAQHASLLAEEQDRLRVASPSSAKPDEPEAEGISAADAASGTSAIVVNAWLARVQRLKSAIAQRPDFAIPELELLTPADWLQVTRAELPDDERALRKALAALRTAAKDHLVYPLTRAMRTYLDRNAGELPPNVFALATYFEKPVDPAILQRYEMIKSGNVKDIPKKTAAVLREKAAVDQEFDIRLQVDANGVQGRPGGITAWIEGYWDRYAAARDEFKRAHNGATTTDVAQLVPFMQPPLTPAQLQMVLRFEQERAQR
jgi:hypothetical protein